MDQLSTTSSLTTPSSSPQRRGRLQRSERLHSDSNTTQYSSWETLVKDSFEKIAWPMRITSCDLNHDRLTEVVPTSSSATELISRRGVFSRRHYGSVDQLPQSELDVLDTNCRRFRLENGESLAEIDEVFGSPSTPVLENPEHQTRWYFKYFLGKLHQNYVGMDNEKNPYFLSIVSQDSSNKCMPLLRAILFRKQGTQKIVLPYNPNQKLTVKQILLHFPAMDTSKTPKELFSADIQKDLLLLEEQEGSVNFKFGVVYMKSGQKCDDEMLSNEFGSRDFEEFLNMLGEKIVLKDWERFRGGLDVKGDMTGKYSIYTLYEGHEIMFHVSTLLPFSRDNKQQVERKRHIGNDIVNIIFINEDDLDDDEHNDVNVNDHCVENHEQIDEDNGNVNNNNNKKSDSSTIEDSTTECDSNNAESTKENNCTNEFIPNCIKSQFTHIFAVIKKCNNIYRLAIYCDENVPPFGPTLPNPPEFTDKNAFREFLLVKLINGEKATFQTPTFSKKRERTLEMLIKDLYEEYVHDTKVNMLNRRAFSEVLSDAPKTSRIKEEARQVEFVRIGQALKLEAIVRGDAPTSLASAGSGSVFKRSPWEPQCFYPTFCHKGQVFGDSFGDDAIFLSVDEGTYLIKEDQSQQLVFDKTFSVRQMSVVEDYGIMIIRGGSSTHKDNHRLYIFRLNEFENIEQIQLRSKNDLKDRRIEKTRGCHLFSILNGTDGFLRMIVCIGKKILIYQWKYTLAWTSWRSSNDNETVDGFLFLKEIVLHDTPTIATILEKPVSSNTNFLICLGFKHHFEIVCEQTGQSTKLHEADNSKRTQTQLIAALDLCDGQEIELLLCYNHTCHFQKLIYDNNTNEFDFHWNTSPTSIVCAFPYIIAFTPDSIEIRLLVNGNLVHTVAMADLQLITSKKDIFFVTTAPEFIAKEYRIKGLDNEQDNNNDTNKYLEKYPAKNSNDLLSNERILEIKHKIDKIHVQNVDDVKGGGPAVSNDTVNLDESRLLNDGKPSYVIVNAEDNLNKYLPIPPQRSNDFPFMQRAKSLQKPKQPKHDSNGIPFSGNGGNCIDKRLISKSSSCSEAYAQINEFGIMKNQQMDLLVPPNSPKLNNNCTSPLDIHQSLSPTKRNSLKILTSLPLSRNLVNNDPGDKSSPEKIKPLRVFRIPLANLTGAHSHYHTHNNNNNNFNNINIKLSNKFQTTKSKIIEDHLESDDDSKFVKMNINIQNNNNNNNNSNSTVIDTEDT